MWIKKLFPGIARRAVRCIRRHFLFKEKARILAARRKNRAYRPRNAPIKHFLVSLALVNTRSFHYKRHGTYCLIANFEVATGQVICPTLGKTRTGEDFKNHIERTLSRAPQGHWSFIVDQLNTQQSESLVRLGAQHLNIPQDLGIKGKSGILKSKNTRAEFLQDETHRIRFAYPPKHASWLTQIECWLSILVRRLLKRASFTSTQELRHRILNVIDFFSKTMAKPFKWTYTGRPLNV